MPRYNRARLAEKFIASLEDKAISEKLNDILELRSGLRNFEHKVRDFNLQKEWDKCIFEQLKTKLIAELQLNNFSVQVQ